MEQNILHNVSKLVTPCLAATEKEPVKRLSNEPSQSHRIESELHYLALLKQALFQILRFITHGNSDCRARQGRVHKQRNRRTSWRHQRLHRFSQKQHSKKTRHHQQESESGNPPYRCSLKTIELIRRRESTAIARRLAMVPWPSIDFLLTSACLCSRPDFPSRAEKTELGGSQYQIWPPISPILFSYSPFIDLAAYFTASIEIDPRKGLAIPSRAKT